MITFFAPKAFSGAGKFFGFCSWRRVNHLTVPVKCHRMQVRGTAVKASLPRKYHEGRARVRGGVRAAIVKSPSRVGDSRARTGRVAEPVGSMAMHFRATEKGCSSMKSTL